MFSTILPPNNNFYDFNFSLQKKLIDYVYSFFGRNDAYCRKLFVNFYSEKWMFICVEFSENLFHRIS